MNPHGWLYHSTAPEGEIFQGDRYHEAQAAGWVDSPAKIGTKVEPAVEAVIEETPKNKGGRPRKVAL